MTFKSNCAEKHTFLNPVKLFIIVWFAGIFASQAQLTWDNGSGNFMWDTNSINWSGSTWTDGSDASFGATGAGAITVTNTRSVGNITVNADGYSFSGGTLDNFYGNTFATWLFNYDTTIYSTLTTTFTAAGKKITQKGPGTLTIAGTFKGTGFDDSSSYTQYGVYIGSTLDLVPGSSFNLSNTLFRVYGTLNISGGTHTLLGSTNFDGFAVGWTPPDGVMTVSGGDVTTVQLKLAYGTDSTYTQTGGHVTVIPNSNPLTAFGVQIGTGGSSAITSVVNLDGGVLEALQIAPSASWQGTATINLNGGTFRANGQALNYDGKVFSTTNTANSIQGNIFVQAGGAIIDSAGFSLTNGQALQADPVSTGGGLTKLGDGSLTIINPDNTYTGPTTISGGTLALSGVGAIPYSSLISVTNGAMFDVSGLSSTFALGSSQTLSNSAASTGALNGSLDTGSGTVSVSYTNGTPALSVANGVLTLSSGTTFNINNTGPALAAGSYKIIAQAAGGSITGTLPSVTVGGGGIVGGGSAALVLNGGELYLQVTGGTLYPPVLSSAYLANGEMVLSFSGTNGQAYRVLSSTNLTTALSNWTEISSGTLTGGMLNYTSAPAADPQRFYIITSP